jgi:LytS/YehU family sensor histidine kinase
MLALYRGTFFVVTGVGYWFARHAIDLEKYTREQEYLLRKTERSLLESNLTFLKNQLNPHFLVNSLNFLYTQVYPHSENAARGILLPSDAMRYALHEEINGKVMLVHEVKHLNNYIEIKQLRFNHQLQIDFQAIGGSQSLMILPLVLITFVENCFKHRKLADAPNPLTTRLEVVQSQLTFCTHNKKRHGPKEKSTGIGLANARRRLELLYQGRYELTLSDTPDDYLCTLSILL